VSAVLGFPALQRRQDLIDQLARRLRAQFDGDARAAAVRRVDEVDAERMVERRVIRVVEIDIRGVDPHPAIGSLRAAGKRGFPDDVGAHVSILCC
jgi:hypothetical protein